MKNMVIPRDFIYDRDALICYFENLSQFIGKKISQKQIQGVLQKQDPDNGYYTVLGRKITTLRFYGFVYYNDKREFMLNEHFKEYVECLKKNEGVSNSFLKILLSCKKNHYDDSKTNFFELLIDLLKDKSILYLDHIEVISYVQYYDRINDFNELKKRIKSSRTYRFTEKVKVLEDFYGNDLGTIATRVHDAKTYLFSFLESNGFYTVQNSLQSETYDQSGSARTLEDKRLYLSEGLLGRLLGHINGHEHESIVDEIKYNSELEDDLYEDPDKDISKLINKSEETDKTIVKRYKTDIKLRNNALDNSGYICEIGKLKGMEHKTFPSRRYEGDYAEVHHLIPMHAQENDLFVQKDKLISLDQISNLIVLCPTCHSKLHYGKSSDVKPELELLFEYRKEALIQNELFLKKEELLAFYKI